MAIITVDKLRKSYGKVQAVKEISFKVEAGSLFAFLGPNGAGKSTTIEMLCTLVKADGGTVMIDGNTLGRDDDGIRSSIGVVFQDSVLDPLLRVGENLSIRAGFYGLRGAKAAQAVKLAARSTDITDLLDQPYGTLSGGQRRRVDIARALLNSPKILFLDEPTTGLDPKSKESVWKTVFDLQRETGMTIFLTTHYMEEAATADAVTVICKGRIAAEGTPNDLKIQYTSDRVCLKPLHQAEALAVLDNAGLTHHESAGIITAGIADSLSSLPLLEALRPHIESFEVIHGSMEDAFLNIIEGGNARG